MPEAGSIVTCRVLSVNPGQATVSIICVGPNKLHTSVSGTVRKQNVRDHQVDTVSPSFLQQREPNLIQPQRDRWWLLLLHMSKSYKNGNLTSLYFL